MKFLSFPHVTSRNFIPQKRYDGIKLLTPDIVKDLGVGKDHFKAIVFDFDDTIVESEKWKKKIFYFVIR